jgi:hypothetical protein
MSFSGITKAGIDKIYKEDFATQEHYLNILYKQVRKPKDVEEENFSVPNSLFRAKAFFVPNEEYMANFFGMDAMDPIYDMYDYAGNCTWQNYIVFPIGNVAGTIVGFAGFDPLVKLRKQSTDDKVLDPYYKYSNATVFNRGKYLYCLDGVYEKAVKDGYLVLSDGIFDMLNLTEAGFNAGSGLGSIVGQELLFQLKFIKHLFVAEDNDKAGRELYLYLKDRHPGVHYVRQNQVKDADDIIKSEYGEEYIRELKNAISTNSDLVLRFKPRR